jgi:hypothetical protein
MGANVTTYPPDTFCFAQWQNTTLSGAPINISACSNLSLTVTKNMADFLNLTSNNAVYIQAYCLSPPNVGPDNRTL